MTAHAFFTSTTWTTLKLAFKAAIAVTISLALGQNTAIASIESSTMYLSSIFVVLNMPIKSRGAQMEQNLMSALLIATVVPFCMLGYLCSKATRSASGDLSAALEYQRINAAGGTASLAVFYQGRPAAIAALFLFILSWFANLTKTIFVPFTFSIVGAAILGAVLFLEGYLAPTWATFYQLVKQLLYNTLIGIAVSTAVNLVVFPYNAREPYLKLVGDFLTTTQQMISFQSAHFSSTHLRIRQVRNKLESTSSQEDADSVEKPRKLFRKSAKQSKPKVDEIGQLQALRSSLTATAAAMETAKKPAKREWAYGHLSCQNLQQLHKLCRAMLVPLFGCNLWSQIAGEIRSEYQKNDTTEKLQSPFLEALGIASALDDEEEAELFNLMEDEVAPRFKAISTACDDAIDHIKRGLHLAEHKRAPFYLRHFIRSPAAYTTEDALFSDKFEEMISGFWRVKHIHANEPSTYGARQLSTASLLIIYMEATIYAVANDLLKLSRWTDDMQASGIMRKPRFIIPRLKRYKSAIQSAFHRVHSHSEPGSGSGKELLAGADDSVEDRSYHAQAADVFLTKANPVMLAGPGGPNALLMLPYKVKRFIFESEVSAFGFRAAIAMLVGALPAFFPNSVGVFLQYRLLWIPMTVLIGLQPVLGRGVAAIVFRLVGTIIGGVLGLIVMEAGRVPGGQIPLFFITAFPQFYVLVLNPKVYLLPALLSIITELLIVGYGVSVSKLGIRVIEASGQAYLHAPELMGRQQLRVSANV